MAMKNHSTIVGVFTDREQAQRAVNELRRMGFSESQIGVAHRDSDRIGVAEQVDATDDETYASEGAAAGLATGAGVGALWGLGIIAGVLPAIGPAIAGGTLAAVLSSAAAGAAAAGLGGALVGLGLSKDEADYYNTEFEAGRTVVTVSAPGREAEARAVLQQFGSYDVSQRDTAADAIDSARTTAAPASSSSMLNTGKQPIRDASCPTTTGSHATDDANRITAFEEELKVEKRPVATGGVNVRKEVHTEHKTIDVPVQREEVVIERHPASGAVSEDMSTHQEIHIPIREEQVHVEKQAVAKEDVVVGKRTVRDTQRVDETLRKEEIKIDKDPSIRVREQRGDRA
ncbi:MAG: YsnF/AvaK domain-containing protein [Aureliella sp.]